MTSYFSLVNSVSRSRISAFLKVGATAPVSFRTDWKFWLEAIFNAPSEISTPVTTTPGTERATVQAMHPDPVQRSRTFTGAAFLPYAPLILLIREQMLIASRHISSVSGRGMRTSGPTLNSNPQNSALPITYWMGSPFESLSRFSLSRASWDAEIWYSGSTIWV